MVDNLQDARADTWRRPDLSHRFDLPSVPTVQVGTPPVSLADALRDGDTLERELGRGGMATVFLARDLKHDRLVAIKVLRPDLAARLGFRRTADGKWKVVAASFSSDLPIPGTSA